MLILKSGKKILFAALLLATATVIAPAEKVSMTMYYPAPVGNYNAITANEFMVLKPSPSPENPKEGTVHVDEDSRLNIYLNEKWNRVLTFSPEKLGERTLNINWTAYPGWYIIGQPEASAKNRLQITELAPQSGLYSITWGGKLTIQAETAPYWLKTYACDPFEYWQDLCDKHPTVASYCSNAKYYQDYCEKTKHPLGSNAGKVWVWVYNYANGTVTYDEYSDTPNDGIATEIDIGGSTFAQMYRGYRYYPTVYIYAQYAYPWNPYYSWNTVEVKSGAFIKGELLLPL